MQWDLALYDLIVPYVLRGAPLGPIHAAVSAIFVQEYDEAISDEGVVVRGVANFSGNLGAFFDPATGTFGVNAQNIEGHPRDQPTQRKPWIDILDSNVAFELHVTREASAIVDSAASGLDATNDADTIAVLNGLDASPTAPSVPPTHSDYPNTTFSLNLVITGAVLRPPFLHGAELQPNGTLLPISGDDSVAITLPRFKLHFAQGPNVGDSMIVSMESFGATGLDDPGDLAVAELIRMTPPYAFIGRGETVGIGFVRAVLDLSNQSTPPEVLAQFGHDEAWTGLFLPDLRLFVAPNGLEDFSVSAGAHNLLIGFGPQNGISGDFDLTVIDQGGDDLTISARFVDREGVVHPIERLAEDSQLATASIPMFTQMIVDVTGGLPPYTIAVDASFAIDELASRVFDVELTPDPEHRITIEVTDSRATTASESLEINVHHRTSPAVRPAGGNARSPSIVTQSTIRNGSEVARPEIVIVGYSATQVSLALRPPNDEVEWQVHAPGVESAVAGGILTLDLAPGQTIDVSARSTTVQAQSVPISVFFRYNQPGEQVTDLADWVLYPPNTNATHALDDGQYSAWSDGPSNAIDARIETFEALDPGEPITITGHASYEGQHDGNKVLGNYALARRRAIALQELIRARFPSAFFEFEIEPPDLNGAFPDDWSSDWQSQNDPASSHHWSAAATVTAVAGEIVVNTEATLTRTETAPVPIPADVEPPADPAPPAWFRSIALKVRIVQDAFVAIELSGEVDFQTAIEEQLDSPDGEQLEIPLEGLGNNPSDGITAYRVVVQVDDATGEWIVSALVGADPADVDGLLRTVPVDPAVEEDELRRRARNLLGMTTVLGPVLAEIAPANPLNGDIAPLVAQGALVGVLTGLANSNILAVERVIVYGAEAIVRHRSSGPEINLLFDIETAISASVELAGSELLTIPPETALVVRYKALGLRLGYTPPEDRFQFRPVFDSSGGYSLDLAGPGGIRVGEPLGRILKVLGARMARTNPLNFEIDLGFSVDLGVIAVERARVRLPIAPIGRPELTALAASIDIPGAIRANGYLEIGVVETDDGPVREIRGGLDLTIIPVGLRIRAEMAIAQFPEDTPGGPATGVIVSVEVSFPVAIPLGSSGLGLLGLLGLFAMHYGRNESDFENDATPALAWLEATGGNPTRLSDPNQPNTHFWTPQIDTWAFGLGAVLGTLEGGTAFNLKGVFLLELPGPRILMMMKAAVLTPPPVVEGVDQAAGSVLAVIDLDVGRGTLTIGLVLEYGVEPLLRIRVPIEAFFDLKNPDDWHLYLGSEDDPVIARVISAFDGSGFLMLKGDGLALEGLVPATGFAIGMGLHVELIWGNKEIKVYASVAGGFKALVEFDPFRLEGTFFIRGQVRFLVFSVSASASLDLIMGSDPETGEETARVSGDICAEVRITRRRKLKACLDFSIGTENDALDAPPLIEKMAIVSRAPALVSGTGADQPIDAVLAQGILQEEAPSDADFEDQEHPRVPVDAILAFGLSAAASVSDQAVLGQSIADSPGHTAGGWIQLGDRRVRYNITAVTLVGQGGLGTGEIPVAWWSNNPVLDRADALQLALFTWSPDPTPAAIERSEFLRRKVTDRWGTVCYPAAPAAPVLWSFHRERLGNSEAGWMVDGVAWPDPNETVRSEDPDLTMHVFEAWRSGNPEIDDWRGIHGATIQGTTVPCAVQGRFTPASDQSPDGFRQSAENFARGRPTRTPAATPRAMAEAFAGLDAGIAIDRASFMRAAATGDLIANPEREHTSRNDADLCDARVLSAPMLDVEFANSINRVVPFGDQTRADEITEAWENSGFEPSDLFDAIRIECGPIVSGRFLIRQPIVSIFVTGLVVRVLDAAGLEIDRVAITQEHVVSIGQLPPLWIDEEGPWFADVAHAVAYTSASSVSTELFLIELPNLPHAHMVEIGLQPGQATSTIEMAMSFEERLFNVLCFELTRMDEALREDYDAQQVQQDQEAISRYLQFDGGGQALLEYDSTYGVQIEWTRQVQGEDDDPVPADPATFWFRTELAPPKKLDQYMHFTLPNNREQHVFGSEPLRLVFSTPQVMDLYERGDRDLQIRIKAASFRHAEPIPLGSGDMAELPPLIVTPFEETVERLLDGSCVESNDERVRSASVALNVPLDPFTDYILEIEATPAVEEVDAGAQNSSVIHSVAFTTGAYPLLRSFAAAIASTLDSHRWIEEGRVAAFAAQFNTVVPQGAQFDDALRAAGLDPMPVPERPEIVVLWEQVGDGIPQPVGILISAPEPMERLWTLPQLVSEQFPGEDEARDWWEPRAVTWLRLEEGADTSDRVREIIVAPGGQRALVVLTPGSRGHRVQVALVRQDIEVLHGVVENEANPLNIVDLTLHRAPWEE